jgi:hypothetical protein
MNFPHIRNFVLPLGITAHSQEDAHKVVKSIQKLYLDHGIEAGTVGTTGIEFKPMYEVGVNTIQGAVSA